MTVLVLALAWTRTVPRVGRRLIPLVLAVGVFDTGANVLLAIATTHGSLGIVAVLSALYPIMTSCLPVPFSTSGSARPLPSAGSSHSVARR